MLESRQSTQNSTTLVHSWRLDHDERPAVLARRIVTEMLKAWQLRFDPDAVRLVVSELVTNAEVHGEPPISLSLSTADATLLIQVTDASRDLPGDRRPGDDGGFGLTVIRSLATLDVLLSPEGKTVTASLRSGEEPGEPGGVV